MIVKNRREAANFFGGKNLTYSKNEKNHAAVEFQKKTLVAESIFLSRGEMYSKTV